jgi:hypothetical protein
MTTTDKAKKKRQRSVSLSPLSVCSYCEKKSDQVFLLIQRQADSKTCICNECVAICTEIIFERIECMRLRITNDHDG